jgi:hypothetical protein
MAADPPLVDQVYALARGLYLQTASFSAAEKDLFGRQIRETAVDLATLTSDAVTTDDPAERQETLRQAGIACIRLGVLLRLAADTGELYEPELAERLAHLKAFDTGLAHERRSMRR